MKIKFWGARGSIPVSGRQYLKYGGSTTCLEISSVKGEHVIVDAGSGIRLLGKEMGKNSHNTFTMLFTHSHWDHVQGFPFFAPIYRKNTRISMMGCSFSSDQVREIIAKTMQPPGFPVRFEEISAKFEFQSLCSSGCELRGLRVVPIELSHPNQGLGYKFVEGQTNLVFLTDNELGFKHPGGRDLEDYVRFASGADLLIHDADFTPEEYSRRKAWGHSTYRQAVDLAIKAGAVSLGLFHHNQDRSDAEVEKIVAECHKIIRSCNSKLKCFAVREGQELKLS